MWPAALFIGPSDADGVYVLSVAVRHTGTGKMLLEEASAAQLSVGEG